MKKIILLIAFSTVFTTVLAQGRPSPFPRGISTPYVDFTDSYTEAQRDALAFSASARVILHIVDTGINRFEQWNGTAWVEFGSVDLSNYVTLDGVETISGQKTWSNALNYFGNPASTHVRVYGNNGFVETHHSSGNWSSLRTDMLAFNNGITSMFFKPNPSPTGTNYDVFAPPASGTILTEEKAAGLYSGGSIEGITSTNTIVSGNNILQLGDPTGMHIVINQDGGTNPQIGLVSSSGAELVLDGDNLDWVGDFRTDVVSISNNLILQNNSPITLWNTAGTFYTNIENSEQTANFIWRIPLLTQNEVAASVSYVDNAVAAGGGSQTFEETLAQNATATTKPILNGGANLPDNSPLEIGDATITNDGSKTIIDYGLESLEIRKGATVVAQFTGLTAPDIADNQLFGGVDVNNEVLEGVANDESNSTSAMPRSAIEALIPSSTIGENSITDGYIIQSSDVGNFVTFTGTDTISVEFPVFTAQEMPVGSIVSLKAPDSLGYIKTTYATGVSGDTIVMRKTTYDQRVTNMYQKSLNVWEALNNFKYNAPPAPATTLPTFVAGSGSFAESATNAVSFTSYSPTSGWYLVVDVSVQELVDFNTPTGWTKVVEVDGAYSTFARFAKFSVGTEGTDGTTNILTFDNNGVGGQTMYATITGYSGVNTTTPYEGLSASVETTSNPVPINSVTTTVDNCLIVAGVLFQRGSGTFDAITTAPTDYTEVYSNWTNSGGDAWHLQYTQNASTSGVYVADSIEFSNIENVVTVPFALRPE